MNTETPAVPPSPGVGARRKGPKGLPTLPRSAFAAPESSASDSFPIPHSPTTAPPARALDACVARAADWRAHAAAFPGGAVVFPAPDKVAEAAESLARKEDMCGAAVVAIVVPLGTDVAQPGVHFTTAYDGGADVAAVRAALAQGKVVNVDVGADLAADERGWDALEDFLTQAAAGGAGKLVLANVLPPPDDLALPIVKLLTHARYTRYQAHAASLSLVAGLRLALRPPAWGALPAAGTPAHKEWKRRIKMYLGPALEAFGFERLVFGSGDAPDAAAWLALAYEAFAELGVEQDAIDAVFGGNAAALYAA